jgi:hypothetical protein
MVDVKSALSSLEWTSPRVPKPLNENIEELGSFAAADRPAGDDSIATRMTRLSA